MADEHDPDEMDPIAEAHLDRDGCPERKSILVPSLPHIFRDGTCTRCGAAERHLRTVEDDQ